MLNSKSLSFDFICWLAGFFDGEGCITGQKGCVTKVQLAQSGDIGRQVLTEVQRTLGIGKLNVDCKNHLKPAWRLCIYRKEDVAWFLNMLLPFLKVKRKRALEALAYLNDVNGRLTRSESNFIQKNCRTMSIGEISHELDRSIGTIRHFLKCHELPRYRRKNITSLLYTVRSWIATEDEILIKEYSNKTSKEIGLLLGRSSHSIRARARLLGIATKSKSWRWHRL